MWLAEKWTDYELLDCSDGEKLERWGQYTLVRPEPQAIWRTPREHPGWQNPDARYRRSNTGGGRWQKHDVPDSWRIGYENLELNACLMNFKHTGIFPEQAVNWDYIAKMIQSASSEVPFEGLANPDKSGEISKQQPHQTTGRAINVLNLFAYTGGATLAAAAAGAYVCHVDAARGMVFRAKENAKASGLGDKPIRWIIDDCAKFVEREIKRGRKYDALIMDPPSYGRGPSGEIWKLEDSLYDFVKLCSGVLIDNPLFVLINSYTTGLSPATLSYITQSLLGGQATSSEIGLPVKTTGIPLPCGSTCRWTPDES